MIRFEVEQIKGGKVTIRLSREEMDDSLLVFEEGDYVVLQEVIKPRSYTCKVINPRDRDFYHKGK